MAALARNSGLFRQTTKVNQINGSKIKNKQIIIPKNILVLNNQNIVHFNNHFSSTPQFKTTLFLTTESSKRIFEEKNCKLELSSKFARFSGCQLSTSNNFHFSLPSSQKKRYYSTAIHLNTENENEAKQINTQKERTYDDNEKKPEMMIILWLAGCTLLVFGIIVIGGITRLTESGLSMTDWKFHGNLPPITEEEWIEEFEKYKQFPEFHKLNPRMTVEEFKGIYFWEYLHRMWGRFIGVSFALPYAYFAMKGKLSRSLNIKCGALLAGIGVQGLVGWWMVKSGLQEPTHDQYIPRVSQYRLATHLCAAFLLYAGMFWTTVDLFSRKRIMGTSSSIEQSLLKSSLRNSKLFAAATTGLVFLTAMSGAFVAGLDAGLVYNEFPYMGDSLVPEESWDTSKIPLIPISPLDPKFSSPDEIYNAQRKIWLRDNLFENSASVQFNHRVLGITTATVVSSLYFSTKKLLPILPCSTKLARHSIFGVVILQVSLGISTLLYLVPVPLAAAHQAGSVLLLSSHLWFLNQLKKIRV